MLEDYANSVSYLTASLRGGLVDLVLEFIRDIRKENGLTKEDARRLLIFLEEYVKEIKSTSEVLGNMYATVATKISDFRATELN